MKFRMFEEKEGVYRYGAVPFPHPYCLGGGPVLRLRREIAGICFREKNFSLKHVRSIVNGAFSKVDLQLNYKSKNR